MKKDKTMLNQIIEYCSKNGITSYELAKHLPLSQVALHGILSGATTQPRIKNVKLIYDFLFKDENTVSEPEAVYETPMDVKIAEHRSEIQKIKKEISSWEEKIKQKPENSEEYEQYIAEYEKQIFLLNKILNTILEAKEDYLKHNK